MPDQQSLLEEISEIAKERQSMSDDFAKFVRDHKKRQSGLDSKLLEVFQRATHIKK